jgi:dCMP deaminase
MSKALNRETEFLKRYLRIAWEIGQLSRCKRSKAGAIIVRDGNIIAFGYNGTPRKSGNSCEEYDHEGNMVTKDCVIHAESNCIAKAAQSTIGVTGATLFCTMSPCFNCSIQIHNCGIQHVVYNEQYRKTDGIEFLTDQGILIQQVDYDI